MKHVPEELNITKNILQDKSPTERSEKIWKAGDRNQQKSFTFVFIITTKIDGNAASSLADTEQSVGNYCLMGVSKALKHTDF